MLRVLIVDDEAPARRYMRRLLDASPSVQVQGEAANLEQARSLIHLHQPDAIFLDVILTQGTGFDLLVGLSYSPDIVFVSAHTDYAAQAFDVAAVDYLLKPVSPERLAQAISRLKPRNNGYLATSTKVGSRLIQVHNLTILQAQGDYVLLHSATHTHELMHTTLKRLAEQLPSPPFFSLSRSLIINLEHISHLSRQGGTLTKISFTNNVEPLLVGRTASLRLRRAMA
ncbi:response regulator transcription factor [Alcaligenaceae bacterium]|nr:response regulator transcription factor [Alcaligenaceae bacterium]